MQDRAILKRVGIGITALVAVGIAAAMVSEMSDSASTNEALGSDASNQSDVTPVQVAADDRPIGARRRAFPIDEVDAQDLIDRLGAPWSGGLLDDVRYDSHSGGYSRSIMSPKGSAHIHTLADGKVWNLQLRSGMGDRCGRSQDIAPHIDVIYAKLQPGKHLSRDVLATLAAGLDKPAAQQITIDGVRLSTVGNCIRSLDVRTVREGERA